MLSMTGFGRGEAADERVRCRALVRSWNHRYLDVRFRAVLELPPELEAEIRRRLSARVRRGRVEIGLEILVSSTDADGEATVQWARLDGLLAASRAIADRAGLGGTLEIADVLAQPGIVVQRSELEATYDPESPGASPVVAAVERALEALVESRAREGEGIRAAARGHLASLGEIVSDLERSAPAAGHGLQERARQRLAPLVEELGLDDAAVAREAALLGEKLDVEEELSRLRSHLDALGSEVEGERAEGKRLDFLAQEALRELNTLAAKCRDAGIAHRVVDGKLVVEALREQLQNVE